ncbi:hypothetical protein KVT40_003032 [Elsinoe batatas]|uniref:Metal-dependent protein hydrolase n=1 Tax=Elsinoe batatas TaxID=2601811 RepID=A0A8K0L4S4_9PEZI|nr:hypothetical protein KVT40_003032 [Elsinoe batatas]
MQTAKRMKMTGPQIGTHNGHFHADEALAVYLLRLLPAYQDSSLIRTRDPELLNQCHTVVDVGGVYDDGVKRYDHHQREFNAVFPSHATKLSSAGLVYMHYGKDIIARCTDLPKDHPDVALLYEKLYDDFVEAFDANDNGVSLYDPNDLRKAGLEKKFSERGFSIASVVNRLNYANPAPAFLAKESLSSNGQKPADAASAAKADASAEKTPEQKQAEEDERFLKASHFVGEQFLSELMDKAQSWLPARASVKEAFDKRTQYDPSGKILVLPEGMPWADHLYALEKENGVEGQVLYVLFPENDPEGKTRIRAVGIENGGFENRKALPAEWRGLRDEELSKVAGIPGCIFIHASGFIGGNATPQGALDMAKKALTL